MKATRRHLLFLILFTLCVLLVKFFQIRNAETEMNYLGFEVQISDSEINPRQLLNLNDFRYMIKPDCAEQKSLLALILMHSYVGNDHVRAAHREAITNKELETYGFKRVFMLADIPAQEKFITQYAIRNEAMRFGDILQGNFIDAYRNLTYKHVMGLKYVAENCQHAQFVIKMDDDIVFDVFRIHNMLQNLEVEQNEYFIKGYVLSEQAAIREKHNKWFVTKDEYSGSYYPPYMSGWFYVANFKTIHALVVLSETTDFFWIDDIYVTGILTDHLSISLDAMNDEFSSNSEFIDCCIRDTTTKRLQCSYLIGPNGGDHRMIINFVRSTRVCYLGGCRKRDGKNHVRHTCVAEFKDLLNNKGQPEVKLVKLG